MLKSKVNNFYHYITLLIKFEADVKSIGWAPIVHQNFTDDQISI